MAKSLDPWPCFVGGEQDAVAKTGPYPCKIPLWNGHNFAVLGKAVDAAARYACQGAFQGLPPYRAAGMDGSISGALQGQPMASQAGTPTSLWGCPMPWLLDRPAEPAGGLAGKRLRAGTVHLPRPAAHASQSV
jgi:hypothetical protein